MDGCMKSHSFENLSVVSVALSRASFLEPGLVFREGRTERLLLLGEGQVTSGLESCDPKQLRLTWTAWHGFCGAAEMLLSGFEEEEL